MKKAQYLRRGPFFTILYNVEYSTQQIRLAQWSRRVLLCAVPTAIVAGCINYTTWTVPVAAVVGALFSLVALTLLWDHVLTRNGVLVSIRNTSNSPAYIATFIHRRESEILPEDMNTILRVLWFTHRKGSLSPMTEGVESHIERLVEKSSLQRMKQEDEKYEEILNLSYGACDTEPLTIIAEKPA